MKTWILLLTNMITVLGVFTTFVILLLPKSNYFFLKAFESMFWVTPIILPLLIILFIFDALYCNMSSRRWLLTETLIIMLTIAFFALSKYSLQIFYTFGSMWVLTQIIKYFIFSRYCTIKEKN